MRGTPEGIRKSVVEHLLWDGRIEGADIDVQVDGHHRVTLTGTAPSYLIKQAAGEDALTIAGVTALHNQIRVHSTDGGPQRRGEDLHKALSTLLALYPSFSADRVEVSVNDGNVELHGAVDAYWKKLRAEELAFNVKGVHEVRNELAVTPSRAPLDREIAASIQEALQRTGSADLSRVNVTVRGGRVTLSGTVDDWGGYAGAHNAAKYTRGVVDLTNELTIGKPGPVESH